MIGGGEEPVVGAGFGGDVEAPVTGDFDLRERIGGADMEDVKRAAGEGGDFGGALDGAGFEVGGSGYVRAR